MREFELLHRKNWLRLGIGIPIALAGVFLFTRAGGCGLDSPVVTGLGAMALMGVGAFLCAPVVAELFANGFMSGLKALIHPEQYYDRIPLRTSQAEALDKAGHFQRALDAYAVLIQEYPEEVKPIIARIRIAVERLHDPALAAQFYEEGMATLTSPRHRRTLTEMHDALQSELAAPSLHERCHSLAPRRHPPAS